MRESDWEGVKWWGYAVVYPHSQGDHFLAMAVCLLVRSPRDHVWTGGWKHWEWWINGDRAWWCKGKWRKDFHAKSTTMNIVCPWAKMGFVLWYNADHSAFLSQFRTTIFTWLWLEMDSRDDGHLWPGWASWKEESSIHLVIAVSWWKGLKCCVFTLSLSNWSVISICTLPNWLQISLTECDT